jgi:Na+/H+-dicarboxylate symporter
MRTHKKHLRIGLLPRIIIAILLGIGAGLIAPTWVVQCFATFNAIFSSLLNFIVPLLIVGFVAPAISEIGKRAGAMLGVTILIAYVMTFASGMLSYATASTIFPSLLSGENYTQASAVANEAAPFFTLDIKPTFDVMTALVLAILLGFGAAVIPTANSLRSLLSDFRDVISMVIRRLIIPLLPIYIFGIYMLMAYGGVVGPLLSTFIKIIVVIFALHIGVLIIQYAIAALFSGYNPLKALITMLPAYFTALGTQSSAATIPVTLARVEKMGVNKDVAGFVVPLCATIHMSGSTLKIVACAIALMICHGIPYDVELFAGFIAMLGITIVAAPGVPGGAIMASLGLLSSILGFSDADNAMMIALYITMDSFGTACNITGDGAIAQIIDRIFRRKHPDPSI